MTIAWIVIAKAPRPGLTKTRLEPRLGAAGCAALQTELLRAAGAWACANGAGWIAYTPAEARDEIAALVPAGARLVPQPLAGFGERLADALAHVAARHEGPVAVVATDAPALAAEHARATETAFAAGADVVIGPALDGGYYLLAARRPHPALFAIEDAAWGGPEVLDRTLAALTGAGLSVHLLATERDLDEPADAAVLAADPRVPAAIRALV